MPINVFRIDDRLVHGQVIEGWMRQLGLNRLIVASDSMPISLKHLIRLSILPDIRLDIVSTSSVAGLLSKPEIFQDHIMLLVASPLDAYSVVVSGVKVNKINIGGMHYAPGRRQLVKAVSVSDSDVEILKKLKEKGIELEIRLLPRDVPVNIMGMIE